MSQIQEQIILYDLQFNKVAFLENAFNISYDIRMNEASMAQFSLPSDDTKNQYCKAGYYVEIFDHDKRIDLFKITMPVKSWSDSEDSISYSCEHVINTLLDDVLFGLHNGIGGQNGTANAIEYILNQQTETNWVLGECEFNFEFVYDFENTTLKNSLYTIPSQFSAEYLWTTDTTSRPWTINLVALDDSAKARIFYQSNLKSIEREIDYTRIFNKVYALGAGEGINQLTIDSVELNGNKYVEDSESIAKYGVKQYILTDRSCKNAQNLFSLAQNFLEEHKEPPVTYKVSAVDLSSITGKGWDQFVVGTMVLVKNYDMRLPIKARVKRVSKSDVSGQPWNINLELGNFVGSIASANNRLANQINTEQTVSQGATNLCIINEADNVDSEHPLIIRFYIPSTIINVNECSLNIQVDKFRAYTKATEGGGKDFISSYGGKIDLIYTFDTIGGYSMMTSTNEGSGYHYHTVNIMDHNHKMTIPAHQHDIDLPDHEHTLEYGIYESSSVASGINIRVNGGPSFTPSNLNNIDLMNKLSNPNVPISRGWHTIEIQSLTLGRITATLAIQTYIQSTGRYNK